jgi:hypothetical protein
MDKQVSGKWKIAGKMGYKRKNILQAIVKLDLVIQIQGNLDY